jgi:hypothetical protein
MVNGNLIVNYGALWARNETNFGKLRATAGNSKGVYLLYCGWFPVYIGQGNLSSRILGHTKGRRKVWDRFTWFALADPRRSRELEAIFLRSLPFFLRLNNKQGANLPVRQTKAKDKAPILFKMPKSTPEKKKKHK